MESMMLRSHARGASWRGLCASIGVVLLMSAVAGAQKLVPTGFAPSVHVDSAYFRGETLYVVHRVSNATSSTVPVWGIVLETPATGISQKRPGNGHWFLNRGTFDGRQTVQWMGLGRATIEAGRTSPALILGGVGLPGVVRRWVIAYTPPPKTENPDREPDIDPMVQRSVPGWSVGIVPVPADGTPASLTTRLRALLTRSCGELKWITQAGVCHSLDVKLEHAQSALRSGQTNVARNELSAFANELDAQYGPQPGKRVTDAGYALLSPNVTYLLRHL